MTVNVKVKQRQQHLGYYDITYKDFAYNDFTYNININKCDITHMFFFNLLLFVKSFIGKISYKKSLNK